MSLIVVDTFRCEHYHTGLELKDGSVEKVDEMVSES